MGGVVRGTRGVTGWPPPHVSFREYSECSNSTFGGGLGVRQSKRSL